MVMAVPDYQDVDAEPEIGAANGVILTGLEGSGCAVVPPLRAEEGPVRLDPTLPLLSMLAVIGLVLRRRAGTLARKAEKMLR